MQAHELLIDAKVKEQPFTIVSADDFTCRPGRAIDPRVILAEPGLSLYGLDHARRRALFVFAPRERDLLQAPFFFQAQHEAADHLVAVPYDTLHALAGEIDLDPKRVILQYSTGRCGSTLLSHVLNLNPAVVSYSEPDVFTQLVMLRTAGQVTDAEVTTLLRDAILIMSAGARQQGFEHYAFKFRSYVLSVSDLLFEALPEAKVLFLYRNALGWARSFSRAFGASDAELEGRLVKHGFRHLIPSVDAYLSGHAGAISWPTYLAHMWVTAMQEGRQLEQLGAPLASARFDALRAEPRTTIERLLTHCGLPMPDPGRLAEMLERDSQAGTAGAQDRQEPARRLTGAEVAELEQAIGELDPGLAPEVARR